MPFNPITDAPEVIARFLGYLQTVKGKSPSTISEYYNDLKTFFRYIKMKRKNIYVSDYDFSKIDINDVDINLIASITLTDVFEFMNYIVAQRNNNNATRARKTTSLRSFFKFLTKTTKQLDTNPIEDLETPRIPKNLPKYLTLEQSLDLLASVDGENYERDYCILTLFLNCGLRLSELVSLNYKDIRPDNTMIVTGKGRKQRVVYLNFACQEAIKNYMSVRPNDKLKDTDARKALFISRLNKRLGGRSIQLMVNKYLEKIGLASQGYSVHKLRHTAATLMYQHGNVDIRVLKDVLGHENLGTTEIYTHLSSEQIKQASDSNPLAKVNQKNKKAD